MAKPLAEVIRLPACFATPSRHNSNKPWVADILDSEELKISSWTPGWDGPGVNWFR